MKYDMQCINDLSVKTKKVWKIILLIWLSTMFIYGCNPKKNKVYRIGIICGLDSLCSTIDGFKTKMEGLGYQEGKNIVFDIKASNDDPVADERIIEQFIKDKDDLIFAFPHDTVLIAKNLTAGTNIPVVFAYAAIGETNLVNSLLDPGGNLTGLQYRLDVLTVKRFDLLLEFDPSIKRIWVAYDNRTPQFPTTLRVLRLHAQSKNITLVEVPVTSMDEIAADLSAREKMPDIGIDAILMMPDLLSQSTPSWNKIRDFAQEHNLPISANTYSQMVDGALFHCGNDYVEVGKRAATLANNILKGVSPSDLPVLSPESYLSINMITANALGLHVSEGLLKQAVEIIH